MSYVNTVVIGGWVMKDSVRRGENGEVRFRLCFDAWWGKTKQEQSIGVELYGKEAERLAKYIEAERELTLTGTLKKGREEWYVSAGKCALGGKKYRGQGGSYE